MSENANLLRRDEIAAMEGLRKTHFLNDGAQRVNKSLGDAVGITGFGFHLIEVAPGAATSEPHLHHHEEECVFVLEGTATAHIGDESFAIGPGDFLGYPRGGPAHSIVNTGTGTLRCLVAGQRLPHDVCDYPAQGLRMYRNAGMVPEIVPLAQIRPLGPDVGRK